jgi:DNA-directed RNA polymerase III subunit RPC7
VQEITLPEMSCAKATTEEKALIQSTMKFEEFFRSSCYYLEPDAPKKSTVNELTKTDYFSISTLNN